MGTVKIKNWIALLQRYYILINSLNVFLDDRVKIEEVAAAGVIFNSLESKIHAITHDLYHISRENSA